MPEKAGWSTTSCVHPQEVNKEGCFHALTVPPAHTPYRGACRLQPWQSPQGFRVRQCAVNPIPLLVNCESVSVPCSSSSPGNSPEEDFRRERQELEHLCKDRGRLLRRKKGMGANLAIPACNFITSGPCQRSIRKPSGALKPYQKIHQTHDSRDREELYLAQPGRALPVQVPAISL